MAAVSTPWIVEGGGEFMRSLRGEGGVENGDGEGAHPFRSTLGLSASSCALALIFLTTTDVFLGMKTSSDVYSAIGAGDLCERTDNKRAPTRAALCQGVPLCKAAAGFRQRRWWQRGRTFAGLLVGDVEVHIDGLEQPLLLGDGALEIRERDVIASEVDGVMQQRRPELEVDHRGRHRSSAPH
jgi:hypothetical protein